MKPAIIDPMLATLVKEPVDRPGWVFEEKYDGDRMIAYRRGTRVRLLSRNNKDRTEQFPEIARALAGLPDAPFILDGEIVVLDRRDVSRFQLLQRRAMGEAIRPTYAIFDCLEAGGRSLLERPLRDRREALERIVPERADVLMRARRVPGDGRKAHEMACRKGWEGIIAKDEGAPYEPGRRSRSWLKVKCRKESEFVIGGFTAPSGGRTDFGALLVGLYDGDRLRFTGKVGAGLSHTMLSELGGKMRSLRTTSSPFEPAPRVPGATWIRPAVVAQLAFTEWTRDGKLRQPVFVGLRRDKKPRECTWAEREV
jgi:bifunctional non-homologous end joining protein LigD